MTPPRMRAPFALRTSPKIKVPYKNLSSSDEGELDSPKSPAIKSSETAETIPLQENVFDNQETIKYMRIIDTYKKLGVGEKVELPRLVIAGNQSCGKSSLLENLTGLPVPITTGIGTRFPIEINLIEDEQFHIQSTIISGYSNNPLRPSQIQRLQKGFPQQITRAQFEDLLREASAIFGVPQPIFARNDEFESMPVETAPQKISRNILQIAIRGPQFKSLSFVDTPGLYVFDKTRGGNIDTKSAVENNNLVESLVAEGRTIIVAVMEADSQVHGQAILKVAKDADDSLQRTIGVLTKCDKVTEADERKLVFKTAKNETDVNLEHGWYLIKNRSSSQAKDGVSLDAARAEEERFFSEKEWASNSSGIGKDRMGISALRTGLSNIFCAHIRTEFPKLKKQTEKLLVERRKDLAKLGPSRTMLSEQRSYLKSLVASYQAPKSEWLKDDYKSNVGLGFGPNPGTFLRKLGSLKTSKLRDQLKTNGIAWKFRTPNAERDDNSDLAAAVGETFTSTTENIYTWISHRYQTTKSSSLSSMAGLVPYSLVERLFQEQTANWIPTTRKFVAEVQKEFIDAVKDCLRKLETVIIQEVESKLNGLEESCLKLITEEQRGLQVVASEEQFLKDVREARTLRFISVIARLESEAMYKEAFMKSGTSVFGSSLGFSQTTSATFDQSSKPTTSVAFGSTAESEVPSHSFKTLLEFTKYNKAKLQEALTHERQVVYEIHDILKAYYSTSVQHYVDSVCKNKLNQGFVEEILDIFSDKFVDALPDSEVTKITSESLTDRKNRRELMEAIERLEKVTEESEAILREPLH